LSLLTNPPHSLPYTLSLHDALPIYSCFKKHSLITLSQPFAGIIRPSGSFFVLLLFILKKDPDILVGKFITSNDHLFPQHFIDKIDRKSTRLNSSHVSISYAVFCLKK